MTVTAAKAVKAAYAALNALVFVMAATRWETVHDTLFRVPRGDSLLDWHFVSFVAPVALFSAATTALSLWRPLQGDPRMCDEAVAKMGAASSASVFFVLFGCAYPGVEHVCSAGAFRLAFVFLAFSVAFAALLFAGYERAGRIGTAAADADDDGGGTAAAVQFGCSTVEFHRRREVALFDGLVLLTAAVSWYLAGVSIVAAPAYVDMSHRIRIDPTIAVLQQLIGTGIVALAVAASSLYSSRQTLSPEDWFQRARLLVLSLASFCVTFGFSVASNVRGVPYRLPHWVSTVGIPPWLAAAAYLLRAIERGAASPGKGASSFAAVALESVGDGAVDVEYADEDENGAM